ncbi:MULTISPECIES: PAQR family membrane homeostasis protein TrhA [Clostridium]|jgi:channel protein, hemolysin III family|uniref:Hemolysin III n=4 Tax=Clostridium TaxID=1485 RepID=A0A1S8RXI4_CLOBE|nr:MULTISPECIES: hemolysin III family protein [Clostridium]ABR32213.1 channel protein, hemolysin III family [Clostridium beijerinckii NCIMB 8052]AIU04181.1 hemolysin III family channel protein [Clostridium beijerinckii ATCC 35702]ALB48587.1 hemolysin III family protein [Clostridium beijerinckii NRRL B-598]AQS02674.1 hemolysin-III related [Clostridium beijerinckii]AVK49081.1 hemolysin [Clostridium sp. MF28]
MEKYLREPINGLTHFIGAVLSLFALIAMLVKVYTRGSSTITFVSVLFFGISMILLYSASATYHSVIANDKVIKILKRLDHSMIFILIAGSYAPFCLVALNGKVGINLFLAVTICAVIGIAFKLCWVTCPRWLSSSMYIGIGWFAVFAIYPMSQVLSSFGLSWLVLGGIMYTIGGIIYALKSDKIKVWLFGRHEIFHIFIMLGTLCHFICVFVYII